MLYYINKIFFNHKVQAVILILISFFITIILVTYNSNDPSFNLITEEYPSNLLGYFGSHLSDLLYQFFGLASFVLPLCCFTWSLNLYRGSTQIWLFVRIIMMCFCTILLATFCAQLQISFLPAGGGGAIGIIIYQFIEQFSAEAYYGVMIVTFIVFFLSTEITLSILWSLIIKLYRFLSTKIPIFSNKILTINYNEVIKTEKLDTNNYIKSRFFTRQSLVETDNNKLSSLPPIELLKQADSQNIKIETSVELKQKAGKLLTILGDFGVKGQMINISQGPVVTLYEFEPAAGTKSSRVIGLSDDIARSLSAISTRIAVIAGRNVLGIELPNKQRAFFCLRELIETPEYQTPTIILPLILGKDLAGKPFVADLAKMPHLLVAGTTGSGKSVAINAMIISLLYRYTPEECRLIMIDPKMLELSTYDGIPHLLTPVVTESSKAVVALKWAVKEMENRYRLMSNIGVRNVASYNAKIREAFKIGKTLERTIQTGFNSDTGLPIYETVPINMEKLPLIVIIVDEMADLMLVAGKDIELLIQRLAQMARAAGIHIIMATQRPSVDVITGVIKANFPSRISFKVTSKIDSRTILGEQGAEQLLGMGDMLYMGNSSKITRVHGPFVDDREVEQITEYLRETGTAEYISAVTQTEQA